MTETARDYIQARAKAVGPYLLPSVRPLAASDEHGLALQPAGSAVLIWHRGRRYILTAAHVVELYRNHAYYVGSESNWIEIEGPFRVVEPPPGGRDADVFDFAFKYVDEDLASRLDGCSFLRADQIILSDADSSMPRSKYIALGWPLNRMKVKHRINRTQVANLAHIATQASTPSYQHLGFEYRTHLVLDFDEEQVVGPSGLQRAPSVTGLSGGGIFRMPSIERIGDVAPPQLAGITIEHYSKEKLMVGVRIDLILAAIDKDREHPLVR